MKRRVVVEHLISRYMGMIVSVSSRYRCGVWSPEDIQQQLILELLELGDAGKLEVESVPSILISTAIDIVRLEKYRNNVDGNRYMEDRKFESAFEEEMDFRMDWEEKLNDESELVKKVFNELMEPSEKTSEIAAAELDKKREERRKTGKLLMNTTRAKLFHRHHAQSLGVSKATFSRAVGVISNLVDDDGK